MIRRFKFEGDIAESLDYVPMAVRRKLDRVGLQIELAQWQRMPRSDRLAICHLPANLEEEREALELFIRDAIGRIGAEPVTLTEEAREHAEPPSNPPEDLIARAAELGFTITPAIWTRLDADERYALARLGSGSNPSPSLAAALKEIVAIS